MDRLTPNSPKGRLDYVLKTYIDGKNARIIPMVATISLNLFGRDANSWEYSSKFGAGLSDLWFFEMKNSQRLLKALDDSQAFELDELIGIAEGKLSADPYAKKLTAMSIEWVNGRLPDIHDHDFLVPWIARELGRLSKAMYRGTANMSDWHAATENLSDKSPAIAMWASMGNIRVTNPHDSALTKGQVVHKSVYDWEKSRIEDENDERPRDQQLKLPVGKPVGIDIGKLSLADALEEVASFDPSSDNVSQGEVIYTFDNGWTVQWLRTQEQLGDEGAAMQHCVGGYGHEVSSGKTAIYSLRDPRGKPHATIEYSNLHRDFAQIKGKQNVTPAEKYHPYLKEFIYAQFDGNAKALIMAGISPREVFFDLKKRGSEVKDLDLSDGEFYGGDGGFYGVDFSGMKITGVDFSYAKFGGASFKGATLAGVFFEHAELEGVSFEGAVITDSSFVSADASSADFRGARVDADFQDADLSEADFSGAKIKESFFRGAELRRANFEGAIIDDNTSFPDAALGARSDVNWIGTRHESVFQDEWE